MSRHRDHETRRGDAELRSEHQPAQDNGPGVFSRFAEAVSRFSGRPLVFFTAVALVLVWAVSGPAFGFSSTWQLIINTTTTIVTFLMVFLIQATQNRDNEAVHLKLDELIEATRDAHDDMIDLEHQSEDVIKERQKEMQRLRERAERLSNGRATSSASKNDER